MSEQALLDDIDEQEAVRVFAEQAQKAADHAIMMAQGRGYGYEQDQYTGAGADYDRIPVPTKRPRHSRLGELGVVKSEEVVSVQGTPGQTPKPGDPEAASRSVSIELGIGENSSSLSAAE